MTAELLIEARGQVEIATLNRPDRLNALNEGLVEDLNAYFGGLADRPEGRAPCSRVGCLRRRLACRWLGATAVLGAGVDVRSAAGGLLGGPLSDYYYALLMA